MVNTENDEQIKNFCANVKTLRKKYGLSKEEMAKILHIGAKSLTIIESGTLPVRLSANIVIQIYRSFGILPSDIITPLIL